MTEQCKHEWEAMHGYLVWCPKCRRPPKAEDVIRALNATERLSAEDARLVAKEVFLLYVDDIEWKNLRMKKVHDDLLAYANILEGKDE